MPTTAPTSLPQPALASEAAIDLLCLRQSYAAMPSRGVTTSIAALATAGVLAIEAPLGRLLAWASVVLVFGALRVWFGLWVKARPRSDDEIRRVLPTFTALMVLPAMWWGVLIAVTGFSTSMVVVPTIMNVISGMMAAGAHSTALTPRVMVSSVVFSFTPLFVHMALSGEPVLWGMLFICSGYIVTVLGGMKVNNREARESIALRFENQDLVARLVAEKDKAERANREKTRFMAAASHDVRQPLHAMGLFVDTLKEHPLEPPARRLLSSIELAHESLVSLHEGLLDVSVIDAGGLTPRVRPVKVQELLHLVRNEAGEEARKRGLDLQVRGVDETILTDPDLLLRVLRNLVGNALSYTPRGRVLVAARGRGSQLLMQVWDTGIGIPGDQLSLIFNELHQVGNPSRDRSQGLGLGLSIVQRLADVLGFEVTVRSALGKGSVFSFRVPLASAAAEVSALLPAANDAPPAGAAERVAPGSVALLVDDDGLARSAMASMLGQWGYEVVAAQNADDALHYLAELERVDLVVSDLWLPGRSGLDFLTEVGATSPRLKRVLISGDTAPQTALAARAAGVTFIRKPVRASHLRVALEA